MTSGFVPISGEYLDFSSSFYIRPCLFSFGLLFSLAFFSVRILVFGILYLSDPRGSYLSHGGIFLFFFSTPFFTSPFYFVYIGPVLRPNDGDSADPMLV
jgi:hypothetical protein